MANEAETMFRYDKASWHSQGTEVDHALTAREAIEASGLDWAVDTVPVYTRPNCGPSPGMLCPSTLKACGEGKFYNEVSDKVAVMRRSDNKVLSVLGKGYTPVQNVDAFNFFDQVVADGKAKYHMAGALAGGKRVWIMAKINGGNGGMSINGDPVDKYLWLFNGHDGQTALRMLFAPIRLKCTNVLMGMMRQGRTADMFYARHSGSIIDRVGAAQEILGISMNFYEDFAEQARILASHQLPAAQMPKLLAAAFGSTGAIPAQDVVSVEDFTKRSQERMFTVTRLFEGEGKGLNEPGIKGTKWAAYNAVVEYVDFGREYKGANGADTRLKNTISSKGAAIKQRAWDYLVK